MIVDHPLLFCDGADCNQRIAFCYPNLPIGEAVKHVAEIHYWKIINGKHYCSYCAEVYAQ